MALPAVLLLTCAMLATSIASFDASIAATRRVSNFDGHLRAANAADAALSLCARALDSGLAPVLTHAPGQPPNWRQRGVFDGPAAYAPLPRWPGSARPPQCIVERLRLAKRPHALGFRITARGFGATEAAEAWLQLLIVREGGVEARRWRRIARRYR
jgi:Tfp pilus assembly protein PilX